MGNPKVNVLIFDNDLRARKLKKYEISNDGTQIRIVSGGEGHFMPTFDSNSFLDLPSWKKYLIYGERTYKRVYFVKNKGEKCVNFFTGLAFGPSREQLKRANLALLAEKIGADSNKGTPWYIWAILAFSFLSFFLLLQISGVIR